VLLEAVMAGAGDEMTAGSAGQSHLRASDADREQVIGVLKAAFVQGRITKDELDLRVGQALLARTYAEQAVVTADLPAGLIGAEPPRKPAPRSRPPRNREVRTGALVTATAAGLAALLWVIAFIFAGNGAAALAAWGATATVLVASALTASLMLGSWLDNYRGGELPPGNGGPNSTPHPAGPETARVSRTASQPGRILGQAGGVSGCVA
jgi:Domain of unknown function (DUF1707)